MKLPLVLLVCLSVTCSENWTTTTTTTITSTDVVSTTTEATSRDLELEFRLLPEVPELTKEVSPSPVSRVGDGSGSGQVEIEPVDQKKVEGVSSTTTTSGPLIGVPNYISLFFHQWREDEKKNGRDGPSSTTTTAITVVKPPEGNKDVRFVEPASLSPEEEEIVLRLRKEDNPPVLFHWEKPGYSPTLPPITIPPTTPPPPGHPPYCIPNCPNYILVETRFNYQVRKYPSTTWVSHVAINENRVLAELEGFMRLHDYFRGLNERGEVHNLTVPYLTQVRFSRHPGVLKEVSDYTISMYLPPIHGADPPKALTSEVLIDGVETSLVFVQTFEAWYWELTDKALRQRAARLMDHLRNNGEAFFDRYIYLAAYDRPEMFQATRYELWIYATRNRNREAIKPRPQPQTKEQPVSKLTAQVRRRLCRGVECPPFHVLRVYKYGIQKRRYYDGVYATASLEECHFSTLAVWKGFMPLHLYKHGINSHMEVLEATRPIGLVQVKESMVDNINNSCPQNMSVSLYLPQRLHNNPPVTGPAAPTIRITRVHDMLLYVQPVGGYLLDPLRVATEVADFSYRLNQLGLCFRPDEYFIVIYDFIVRFHGRQNEIWMLAENCPNK